MCILSRVSMTLSRFTAHCHVLSQSADLNLASALLQIFHTLQGKSCSIRRPLQRCICSLYSCSNNCIALDPTPHAAACSVLPFPHQNLTKIRLSILLAISACWHRQAAIKLSLCRCLLLAAIVPIDDVDLCRHICALIRNNR